MSIESAVAFYERVEKDTALQAKLKELNTKENISQYVKGELGYDFTLEEMQKVIFERNPEITDEELEAVVGGGADFWWGTIAGMIVIGVPTLIGLAAATAAA